MFSKGAFVYRSAPSVLIGLPVEYSPVCFICRHLKQSVLDKT